MSEMSSRAEGWPDSIEVQNRVRLFEERRKEREEALILGELSDLEQEVTAITESESRETSG
jgi:hypothetical protein